MSIYTQQANNLMERLPVTEQQFIVEFIKKISVSYTADTNAPLNKPVPLKQAIRKFIDGINAVTDEPLDEEFDEIVMDRINITRELDL
jgi:hypothetical protein